MQAAPLFHRGALLGAAVTMLLGCGGGERGPEQEGVEGSGARITALGPAIVDGCSVNLAFDISAPAAIGLVGVAPLEGIAQAPQLSLYAVDGFGTEQLVATGATQVNAVTLALVAQAQSQDTIVVGDQLATFHGTNQQSSVGFADSLRNGTAYTTSESGFYARDSYGDQQFLQQGLAELGWEPVSHATAFLSATSERGDISGLSQSGQVTDGFVGTQGSFGHDTWTTSGFDSTAADTSLWGNRDVSMGIGRLNVRESWGKDQAYSSFGGADQLGTSHAQTTSTQASTTGVGSQTNAIRNAWAIQALDSLDSRHFILRVQALATADSAGLRVFQGTESALYAASDVAIALPGCP